jgi:NAD(P)-dependent dehydrogenase (short-subunit alcohol dehydrogenase family)
MLLKDQVALITGSGRGIGRAIARLFAAEGASVFLIARTETELSAATKEISGLSGRAHYALGDVGREADCMRIVAEARAKFGRIDILVNNAGHYGPVVPVEEYPLAEFDGVIAVHLRAAFLLSKLVLPEMYARGSGVILNISSLSAKAAFPWGSAYAAAKAGMLGLTRITAAEAARKGVRVNAICRDRSPRRACPRNWATRSLRSSASAQKSNSPVFSKRFCKAADKPPTKSPAPRSFSARSNPQRSRANPSMWMAAPRSFNAFSGM